MLSKLYQPARNSLRSLHTNSRLFNTNTVPESQTSNLNEEPKGRWANWTGQNAWKSGLLSLGLMGLWGIGSGIYFFGPEAVDEQGNVVKDSYSDMNPVKAYPMRAFAYLMDFNKSIKDPSNDKLLPDPVKPPYYQPPYTVVIEMTNVLVHPEWKFRSGWRFKRRPALEVFLSQLSPFYEVVIFTSDNLMNAAPILASIDSRGEYIHYRLFRDATRYRDGVHYKDLSCLNRDLSKVIVIDFDKDATSLQPDNALIMPKWDGDDKDRELIDLAAFLRMLAMSGTDDIRPTLKNYSQYNDPLAEFRLRQSQLLEYENERKREAEETLRKKKSNFSFGLPKK